MNDDAWTAHPTGGAVSRPEAPARGQPGRSPRLRPKARIALVINPVVRDRIGGDFWSRALARLEAETLLVGSEITRGDGADPERIGTVVETQRPDVLVAVGGDGTVNQSVEGVLAAGEPAPALAFFPVGTANNVARSLGLLSCRHFGEAAAELAVGVIARGDERTIDLGAVGVRHFVNAFAAGMDADILVTRNRWRQRLGSRSLLAGYPLYLASCAANLLRRRHGTRTLFEVEDSRWDAEAYNVLVTNTALYAGEFRFDPGDPSADGRLDLQVMTGRLDYVRCFVAAWRRHLAVRRGRTRPVPYDIGRVRSVKILCDGSVPSQLDGEEFCCADRYEIRVVPGALRVRVPQADGAARVRP